MSESPLNVTHLNSLNEEEFWSEFGKSLRNSGLGMLPEDEAGDPTDAQRAVRFFQRQMPNIKKLFCNPTTRELIQNHQRRDVALFVATLIDGFAEYFGYVTGTFILIQIYKIGVDRFCDQSEEK